MSYHGMGALAGPQANNYPSGLSPAYLQSFPLTSANYSNPISVVGPVADQCNKSAQPVLCHWAKTRRVGGKTPNFMGRPAAQSDWDAWYKWSPGGEEPLSMDASTKEVQVAGGVSDVMFYGGIALAAVMVGWLVWYARR